MIEESGETLKMTSNESSQPNLSQYFGSVSDNNGTNTSKEEFFDKIVKNDSMMQSCRESKVDLSVLPKTPAMSGNPEAQISISAQARNLNFLFLE